MRIRELIARYKGIINYLIFGVLTTLINVAVYSLCYDALKIPNLVSTAVAWVIAVAFAFVTNKLFVFESRSWRGAEALKEAVNFVACRLSTGAVEMVLMFVFVDLLAFSGTVMKLICNVIVIVLNYVLSKLIVFKKK